MKDKSYEFLQKEVITLKASIDASYDGIHILDNEGKTILINKACERIEGITFNDIGNKTISQLVKEGFYDESITLQVLETKKNVTRVQTVKNGKKVLATGMPIFDDSGNITRVIVNSRDLTDLTNLQHELEKKQETIEKYHEVLLNNKNIDLLNEKLVIRSSNMKKITGTIINVAKSNSTVLLSGESGTGKTLLAKLIHQCSKRADSAFIKIDCGAIPETLFESELFGYVKGAFTGADQKGKIGMIELADKGTLFLDEIGEVPLFMQTKLLRLIQEKKFNKVGSEEETSVDIRIVAATNKDLIDMVDNGTFREDLYYRINVIPIKIPPLRERKDDISPLIFSFINNYNKENQTDKKVTNQFIDALIKYDWPGNIRELENILERAAVVSKHSILDYEDLPENIRLRNKSTDDFRNGNTLKELMNAYEKRILESLIKSEYTPLEMASLLSVDVTNIRRKLHKYNIKF